MTILWFWLFTWGLPICVGLIGRKSMGRLLTFVLMIVSWHVAVVLWGYISSGNFQFLGLIGYFTSPGGIAMLVVQTLVFFWVSRLIVGNPTPARHDY
jgi:hypothetical protein